MMNNGKKEFPQSALEEDVCSKYTRKICCYISNSKGLTKFVKRAMNKRFRKSGKTELKQRVE